ncbi:molecular chaperone TorD family protein [Bacillus sp. B15-48]|uniref:molecular chaperone TorD family protein n=1 Tax=Bacillus sp. B15-48 TaxID=1548601 RepID=UPI00193FD785|nr:molecular chaperone TorD family protein [Bacillus sp. B15-48]MBM4763056.1 hypothetical protein [Bacillus sp. B15-48]
MKVMQEELYGKLALTNILASVWLGDWDRYEEIFHQMDAGLRESFPFHSEYNRDLVQLWHENHFLIPGEYFVSPYFSSYKLNRVNVEERKENLLCLIGTYEKVGFYFPLEQELYPDHLGCITAFISALQQERIKALQENNSILDEQLYQLEKKIVCDYILPLKNEIKDAAESKIHHPFLRQFISYYFEVIGELDRL